MSLCLYYLFAEVDTNAVARVIWVIEYLWKYNRFNYNAQFHICLAFNSVREKLHHKRHFAHEMQFSTENVTNYNDATLFSCTSSNCTNIFDVNASYFHRNGEMILITISANVVTTFDTYHTFIPTAVKFNTSNVLSLFWY